jgi:hypothetical protein
MLGELSLPFLSPFALKKNKTKKNRASKGSGASSYPFALPYQTSAAG